MRVLVTGGSSLIGAGVATSLLARGDEVVVQQRRRSETLGRLGVRQELGDIRDLDVVLAACAGCDAIVHLAAKVGVVGDWEDYRSINVDGTHNVLDAAQRRGIGRVVHVSSPSVAHGGEPIVGRRADTPVLGRRHAWYPESKAMAEIDALAAAGDELGVVAIRPHLVWGPGDTQLVGRIVERAATGRLALVGGGRALVDTTYIDNAVDALITALDAVEPGARCSARAYVVSNGEPRMIRGAGRRDLSRRGRAVRAAVDLAAGRAFARRRRRACMAAPATRRRAAAHPVPRRATRHSALVRPASGPRRSGLDAGGVDRRGLGPSGRLVRRRSRSHCAVSVRRRYPRPLNWRRGRVV